MSSIRPSCPPCFRLLLGTIFLGVVLGTASTGMLGCAPAPEPPGSGTVGPPDPIESKRARLARLVERVRIVDGALQVDPAEGSLSKLSTGSPEEHARALLRRGARAEALETLLDAASSSPISADAWTLLGHQLERAGASDAGLVALRRAAALDPERGFDLASALARRARHDEAATEWRRLLATPDLLDAEATSRARGRLAVASHFAGQPVDEDLLADAPPVLRAIVREGGPPRANVRTLETTPEAKATSILRLGAPVRVDNGGGAELSEPSIVALGDTLAVGWNDMRDPADNDTWRIGAGLSTDGGVTWSDELLRPPFPRDTVQEGDPMTAADPRTGTLWLGAIEFAGPSSRVYVSRRSPGGDFETPVVLAEGSSFDKCWMAAGPAPGQPASTRVYVAYSFPSSLHVSSDLGATWSSRRALDEGGLAFLPRVGPAGEFYVGFFDYAGFVEGPGVLLQKSLDGGATFGATQLVAERLDVWGLQDGSRFPGLFRSPILTFWAVSPVDGTLYGIWADTTEVVDGDANVDLYFTRSRDGGETWTVPRVIHGDGTPPGDQFMPWLEVDASGRLHLVFFDTRHTVQADDVEDGRLDVYYAWSENDGDSWSEMRLTPSSFGTAGIDWPFLGQFVGDYLGLAVIESGTVMVAYPKTSGADLDLFVQRIEHTSLFVDGFESGDLGAWSASSSETSQ